MEGQQPGQTISPQSQQAEPRSATEQSQPQTTPRPPAAQPTATTSAENEPAAPVAGWSFKGDAGAPVPQVAGSDPDTARPAASGANSVSWTASEFIEHSKNFSWYALLAVASVVLAALVFLITRDKISTGAIIFAALLLGIFAARKPRTLQYRLDDSGLTIGQKLYGYELFKSFSVVDEGVVPSIYLLPLKRFMPALTIYYAHADENAILDVLSERLPAEERHIDTVDRFMHRIRF